ncbi:MAG: hypothetical protein ACYC4M_08710 [Thermoleophilia bacterium]
MMGLPEKKYLVALLSVAVVLVALAAWLALPTIQTLRADRLLSQANDEIAAANEALTAVDLAAVSTVNFFSVASIQQTSDTLDNSLPAIDAALEHVNRATDSIDRAAGLARLPAGYIDYLEPKREIAELRVRQLKVLRIMVEELQLLYGDGDVIFNAVEEMDRQWGQVSFNLQRLQGSPAEAGAALTQAAAMMRQQKDVVDARYQESGFYLLDSLSESIEDNARLAELAAALAAAVEAGDQAGAQQAAVALEAQLLKSTDTSGYIEQWVDYSLEPHLEDFHDLQEQQDELDLLASDLFNRRG